jgi:hypothetical protein
MLGGDKLHADDTPVPVLAAGNGKTKTGRLWTYVRDDRPAGDTAAPAVWFSYSPDRKGEHPQQHLRDFTGTLQADAYAGFNQLYENGRIHEAACWAHVRRKFYELMEAHKSHWCASATTAALKSITTPPNARCAVLPLAGIMCRRRLCAVPAVTYLAGLHPWTPPCCGTAHNSQAFQELHELFGGLVSRSFCFRRLQPA